MTNKNLVYYASFFTYTIQGMVAISLGLLIPHMSITYSINHSQSGTMILFMLLGGTIASTVGGLLNDRLGEKTLTIIGSLCLILGYSMMLLINNITIIFILLFIVGCGTGIFNIALNMLVATVSRSNPKKTNALHTFFAIGAVLATIIITIITYYELPWKIFLFILIAMSATSILLFANIHIERHAQKSKSKSNDLSFFKKPQIYILVLLTFFYVGAECSINGWAVTFFNESGIVSNSASNTVLTIFWVLVIIGRLLNQRLSITLESRIIGSSIIILISYVLLLSTSSIIVLIVSVIMLGLSMSAFYPNVVANSSEKLKDNATAIGLILSFGGLGGAVIPWTSGIIAESNGIKAGMYAVIVSIIFLIIASLLNSLLRNKKTVLRAAREDIE